MAGVRRHALRARGLEAGGRAETDGHAVVHAARRRAGFHRTELSTGALAALQVGIGGRAATPTTATVQRQQCDAGAPYEPALHFVPPCPTVSSPSPIAAIPSMHGHGS